MKFNLRNQRQLLMRCTWMVTWVLLGLNLTLAEPVTGQVWDRAMINISVKDASLLEIFDRIKEQSDIVFMYGPEVKRDTRTFKLNHPQSSVKTVLKDLADQVGMKLSLIDQTVIVKLKPRKKAKKVYVPSLFQLIKGTVTDAETGEPIAAATVSVQGTQIGTFTDSEGQYALEVPEDATTLVFSYAGYEMVERDITGKTQIDVAMAIDPFKLEDVVVIGYGTNSRRNLTSAIARIENEEIKDQPVSSFDQALAGRLPGVDISQANGAPGGGIGINIRGVSTISGGTSPLFVVDGVPLSSSTADRFSQGQSTENSFSVNYAINPLSAINPNDIASVEVLKDAAAAAIYGSRASNGVVLITTKSGQYGTKSQINVNIYGGFQQVTKKVDVMNAQEFAEYSVNARNLAWIQKDPANNSADDPLDQRASSGDRYAEYFIPYINGEEGLTDTDWQDEIFRTAPIQNYELSANGGTEKFSYYVSGNYFDQEGIVLNSGLKRYSMRLNLKANVTDRIRLGANFNPSFSDYNVVQTEQNWWREGVIISALMYHPNLSPRNPDGSFRLGELIQTSRSGESSVAVIENPVALAELIDNSLDHTRLLGNTYLELDIIDGLTFKTSFGVDVNFMDRFYYRPKVLNWRNEPAPTSTNNYAWANNSSVFNWLSENTLNYQKSIGKHNVDALVGYTTQRERNERQYLEGRNFPNDNVTTLNSAQTTSGFSEEREWSLISYLGRIQYGFNDTYLFTASIRRDGSSRFGRNTKWGWFPSVSGGWRISDESFFPTTRAISDLKLRASYGLTGNTEIPFYGGTALLGLENYILTDDIQTGIAPITSPNPNLSWETTRTVDVGIDVSFFNRKLTLYADYYLSKTTDLLLNVTVPGTSGFTSSLQNIGELRNEGFEFLLATNHQLGNLYWDAAFNFSTNQNEILSLAPGQTQFLTNGGLNDPAFIVQVGAPIGSYYGYDIAGIFESQEQFESTPSLEGQNQGVGDFIYVDSDGDGDVDPDDRVILGDNNPDFNWGFNSSLNYKDFDLSFNIQGKHGFELFNAMHRYTAETWGNNLSIYLTDEAPRPVWGVGTSSHTRPSAWHVEDGSFIRVRNITVGYTLPANLLNTNIFNSLRIYFSAINPFTFTDYSGFNPEVSSNFGDAVRAGEEFGNYPVAKTFTLGINLNL